jgi:hypothetical protein
LNISGRYMIVFSLFSDYQYMILKLDKRQTNFHQKSYEKTVVSIPSSRNYDYSHPGQGCC